MSTSRKENKRKGLTDIPIDPDDMDDEEEEEYREIRLPTFEERESSQLRKIYKRRE